MASFQLTDQLLKKIERAGASSQTLKKLEPLKNIEYPSKDAFIKQLTEKDISKKELSIIKSTLIIKHSTKIPIWVLVFFNIIITVIISFFIKDFVKGLFPCIYPKISISVCSLWLLFSGHLAWRYLKPGLLALGSTIKSIPVVPLVWLINRLHPDRLSGMILLLLTITLSVIIGYMYFSPSTYIPKKFSICVTPTPTPSPTPTMTPTVTPTATPTLTPSPTPTPPCPTDINIEVIPSHRLIADEKATLTTNVVSNADLQFKWMAKRGTLSSYTSPSITYEAPDIECTDTIAVKLTCRGKIIAQTTKIKIEKILPTLPAMPSPTPTKKPTRTPPPKPSPISTATPYPKPTATPTPVPTLPLARFWSKESKMPPQCQHDISFAQYTENCSGKTCYQVKFANINYCPQKYNKIFWVTQDDKGINVYQQMNISKETPIMLTFRVRGERGGEKIRCGVDSIGFAAQTPLLTLRTGWEQVHLDLTTKDLSNVRGGFHCEMKVTDNAGKTDILFFLENIQFEVKK